MSNYQVYFSEEIKVLMDLLSSHHHELVVVGGWVRDILLGRKPTDVDMASNLSPKEMLKLLKDYPTSMIGIKYGTVGVKINNTWIEITTYRSDHNTLDHRHPSSNQFIDSLEADLKRRDFTINALAINQAGDLVDYVGGLEDLKNQRIKAIGQPDERFSEDALRILRAMRFAITLDFMIDDETQVAMLKQRQLLKHISSERIWEELMKMLNGQHIQSIFLTNAKILLDLLPQSHIPSYLDQTKDPTIRLWMLLDRLDQSNLTKVLQHYKVSNALFKRLEHLYDYSRIDFQLDRVQLKLILSESNLDDLKLCLVYLKFINMSDFYNDLDALYESILLSHEPFKVKDLALNGDDLMALGITKQEIKVSLKLLLEKVISDPLLNHKERLIALCTKDLT